MICRNYRHSSPTINLWFLNDAISRFPGFIYIPAICCCTHRWNILLSYGLFGYVSMTYPSYFHICILYLMQKPTPSTVCDQQFLRYFNQEIPIYVWFVLMITKMVSATDREGFNHSEDVLRQGIKSQLQRTSSYQQLCTTFLDTTSAHGLPRLRNELGRVRKVLWALVFVGMSIGCCYESTVLVKKFLEHDVIVAVHMINK